MKHEPVSGAPLPFNARPFARVAVLGAGSWGTALAVTLARAGVETRLWGRDPAVLRQINAGNSTPHLPGVTLPASLRAVKDMEGADAADRRWHNGNQPCGHWACVAKAGCWLA